MPSTQHNDTNLDKQAVEAVTALFDVLVEMDLEQRKKRKEVSHGRHDKDIATDTRPDEAGQSAI